MDLPGHDFLARAAFAEEQHGDVGGRVLPRLRQFLFDPGPDDRVHQRPLRSEYSNRSGTARGPMRPKRISASIFFPRGAPTVRAKWRGSNGALNRRLRLWSQIATQPRASSSFSI